MDPSSISSNKEYCYWKGIYENFYGTLNVVTNIIWWKKFCNLKDFFYFEEIDKVSDRFFSINSYSSKIINHQRHGKKSELICVDDHHEKLENDRAKKMNMRNLIALTYEKWSQASFNKSLSRKRPSPVSSKKSSSIIQ